MPAASDSHEQYRSSFSSWETRSSVRAKPRRVLDEAEQGKIYFPPELVPVVYHPLVREMDQSVIDGMLRHRLHIYLDFTADLEQLVVSPATQCISRRRSGFDLPVEMLRDAYKICTDEAWHAQFSDDLQRQVLALDGKTEYPLRQPYFLTRLRQLKAELNPVDRPLADLFFTAVSETLISSILSGIPKDARILTAVREMVADHAEDEGRHHAYFARFFEFAWPQLSARQRETIGALLPEFAVAFLMPDLAAIAELLAPTGLDAASISGVIEETYPAGRLNADVRAASAALVRLCERNAVFRFGQAYEAFARRGLVD